VTGRCGPAEHGQEEVGARRHVEHDHGLDDELRDVDRVPAGQLYGGDYCWTPAAAALAQIARVDAAVQPRNDTWRALTTRNAAKLLPGLLDHT